MTLYFPGSDFGTTLGETKQRVQKVERQRALQFYPPVGLSIWIHFRVVGPTQHADMLVRTGVADTLVSPFWVVTIFYRKGQILEPRLKLFCESGRFYHKFRNRFLPGDIPGSFSSRNLPSYVRKAASPSRFCNSQTAWQYFSRCWASVGYFPPPPKKWKKNGESIYSMCYYKQYFWILVLM